MDTSKLWIFALGFGVACACIAGYRTYVRYAAATGKTRFARFMAVFRQSGTILWARVLLVSGFVATLLGNAADWFGGSQTIQDAVRGILPDTKYVGVYTLGVAVLTEYIRRRPSLAADGTTVSTLAPPVDVTKTTPPNPPPSGAGPANEAG